MSFRRDNKTKTSYSKISIGLASPRNSRSSSGEVLKPETINYRTTNLNAMDYSAKEYSAGKNYECHCGNIRDPL